MSASEGPAALDDGASQDVAITPTPSPQITGPGSVYVGLHDTHAAELAESAIPPEIAATVGVRTAHTVAELPDPVRWIGDSALPAVVYPMREVDGTETFQVKPQKNSVTSGDGRTLKYVGPSKKSGVPSPQLPLVGVVLDDGSVSTDPAYLAAAPTLWIVEGCKQALAALAHAPKGVGVLRIAGVWSWKVAGEGGAPGTATRHLETVEGKCVVIIGDADARTNPAVFDGLTELGEAAKGHGAKSVAYVSVPGDGNQGLDDYLSGLPDADTRRAELTRCVSGAKAKPAPLTKPQLEKLRKERATRQRRTEAENMIVATRSTDRPDVYLKGSWHHVSQAIASTVAQTAGGRRLFTRGGVLVELTCDDRGAWSLRKCAGHDLHRQLLAGCRPIIETDDGPDEVPRFDRDLVPIVGGWLGPMLPTVSRISSAPVVRADGSVVARSCYDPITRVLVNLDPNIENLAVPEHPTDEDVAAARHLLRDVLFERDGSDGYDGWLFAGEADRANTIALLLTCVLRSAFPLVPMVVFDGLQRGVGKGTAVKVIAMVAYGIKLAARATPAKDEEMEKRLISDLLAGRSIIFLDEIMGSDGTSRLASPSLQTAITTDRMGGRKLGVSESLELDQDAVIIGAGNNVEHGGDMVRRVLPVRLTTDRPNPDRRNNFRMIEGPVSWAREHRAELLVAVLTLVRAWYDRGQPAAPKSDGEGFGDFIEWERVIGGVLHLAGIEGFATNVTALRDEGDSEASDNAAHLEWLAEVTSGLASAPRFAARDALMLAAIDPNAVPPYDHMFDGLDARRLGKAWKRLAGRWFGDVRIVTDGKLHGNAAGWRVERRSGGPCSPALALAPVVPIETMRVKDRVGAVTEHVRVMPSSGGMSLDDVAASLSGGDDA